MSNETTNKSLLANAAAKAFVDRAQSQLREELAELYIFGSTVCGEAHSLASDVGVLVVLDTVTNRTSTTEMLRDLASDVMLEYGPVVELHILSQPTFEQSRKQGNPFIRNVLREGRSYVKDDNPPGKAEITDQLRQAQQALADAKGARNAELSDVVVINCLYYACFHAAQTALYDRGYEAGSYGDVLSLFSSELVITGDVQPDHGQFLNHLSELRKQADYGYGQIDENVAGLLARTTQFVTDCENVCTTSD